MKTGILIPPHREQFCNMYLDSTMLRIGYTDKVFFDDLVIESVQNLTKTMHHPQKATENPLIFRDKPWERITKFHIRFKGTGIQIVVRRVEP